MLRGFLFLAIWVKTPYTIIINKGDNNEKTFIVISGGITLNADKLTYVNSKTPIVAEGHVKVRKDNELLSTADKIVISPNYESFKIIGNTVSKVYEDKK